jgi:hypothetical protein
MQKLDKFVVNGCFGKPRYAPQDTVYEKVYSDCQNGIQAKEQCELNPDMFLDVGDAANQGIDSHGDSSFLF